MSLKDTHCGAGGGASPVFSVSVVVVVDVVPPSVVADDSFFTSVFSAQPTTPSDNMLRTNMDPRMRFIFQKPFLLKETGTFTSIAGRDWLVNYARVQNPRLF
jgi:hypothetical protein